MRSEGKKKEMRESAVVMREKDSGSESADASLYTVQISRRGPPNRFIFGKGAHARHPGRMTLYVSLENPVSLAFKST